MTEKEIQLLGFEKNISNDSGGQFYYYTKDITRGLTFITNASDEIVYGEWFVEFFDTEIPVRYCEYDKVKSLIDLLESGVVKE